MKTRLFPLFVIMLLLVQPVVIAQANVDTTVVAQESVNVAYDVAAQRLQAKREMLADIAKLQAGDINAQTVANAFDAKLKQGLLTKADIDALPDNVASLVDTARAVEEEVESEVPEPDVRFGRDGVEIGIPRVKKTVSVPGQGGIEITQKMDVPEVPSWLELPSDEAGKQNMRSVHDVIEIGRQLQYKSFGLKQKVTEALTPQDREDLTTQKRLVEQVGQLEAYLHDSEVSIVVARLNAIFDAIYSKPVTPTAGQEQALITRNAPKEGLANAVLDTYRSVDTNLFSDTKVANVNDAVIGVVAQDVAADVAQVSVTDKSAGTARASSKMIVSVSELLSEAKQLIGKLETLSPRAAKGFVQLLEDATQYETVRPHQEELYNTLERMQQSGYSMGRFESDKSAVLGAMSSLENLNALSEQERAYAQSVLGAFNEGAQRAAPSYLESAQNRVQSQQISLSELFGIVTTVQEAAPELLDEAPQLEALMSEPSELTPELSNEALRVLELMQSPQGQEMIHSGLGRQLIEQGLPPIAPSDEQRSVQKDQLEQLQMLLGANEVAGKIAANALASEALNIQAQAKDAVQTQAFFGKMERNAVAGCSAIGGLAAGLSFTPGFGQGLVDDTGCSGQLEATSPFALSIKDGLRVFGLDEDTQIVPFKPIVPPPAVKGFLALPPWIGEFEEQKVPDADGDGWPDMFDPDPETPYRPQTQNPHAPPPERPRGDGSPGNVPSSNPPVDVNPDGSINDAQVVDAVTDPYTPVDVPEPLPPLAPVLVGYERIHEGLVEEQLALVEPEQEADIGAQKEAELGEKARGSGKDQAIDQDIRKALAEDIPQFSMEEHTVEFEDPVSFARFNDMYGAATDQVYAWNLQYMQRHMADVPAPLQLLIQNIQAGVEQPEKEANDNVANAPVGGAVLDITGAVGIGWERPPQGPRDAKARRDAEKALQEYEEALRREAEAKDKQGEAKNAKDCADALEEQAKKRQEELEKRWKEAGAGQVLHGQEGGAGGAQEQRIQQEMEQAKALAEQGGAASEAASEGLAEAQKAAIDAEKEVKKAREKLEEALDELSQDDPILEDYISAKEAQVKAEKENEERMNRIEKKNAVNPCNPPDKVGNLYQQTLEYVQGANAAHFYLVDMDVGLYNHPAEIERTHALLEPVDCGKLAKDIDVANAAIAKLDKKIAKGEDPQAENQKKVLEAGKEEIEQRRKISCDEKNKPRGPVAQYQTFEFITKMPELLDKFNIPAEDLFVPPQMYYDFAQGWMQAVQLDELIKSYEEYREKLEAKVKEFEELKQTAQYDTDKRILDSAIKILNDRADGATMTIIAYKEELSKIIEDAMLGEGGAMNPRQKGKRAFMQKLGLPRGDPELLKDLDDAIKDMKTKVEELQKFFGDEIVERHSVFPDLSGHAPTMPAPLLHDLPHDYKIPEGKADMPEPPEQPEPAPREPPIPPQPPEQPQGPVITPVDQPGPKLDACTDFSCWARMASTIELDVDPITTAGLQEAPVIPGFGELTPEQLEKYLADQKKMQEEKQEAEEQIKKAQEEIDKQGAQEAKQKQEEAQEGAKQQQQQAKDEREKERGEDWVQRVAQSEQKFNEELRKYEEEAKIPIEDDQTVHNPLLAAQECPSSYDFHPYSIYTAHRIHLQALSQDIEKQYGDPVHGGQTWIKRILGHIEETLYIIERLEEWKDDHIKGHIDTLKQIAERQEFSYSEMLHSGEVVESTIKYEMSDLMDAARTYDLLLARYYEFITMGVDVYNLEALGWAYSSLFLMGYNIQHANNMHQREFKQHYQDETVCVDNQPVVISQSRNCPLCPSDPAPLAQVAQVLRYDLADLVALLLAGELNIDLLPPALREALEDNADLLSLLNLNLEDDIDRNTYLNLLANIKQSFDEVCSGADPPSYCAGSLKAINFQLAQVRIMDVVARVDRGLSNLPDPAQAMDAHERKMQEYRNEIGQLVEQLAKLQAEGRGATGDKRGRDVESSVLIDQINQKQKELEELESQRGDLLSDARRARSIAAIELMRSAEEEMDALKKEMGDDFPAELDPFYKAQLNGFEQMREGFQVEFGAEELRRSQEKVQRQVGELGRLSDERAQIDNEYARVNGEYVEKTKKIADINDKLASLEGQTSRDAQEQRLALRLERKALEQEVSSLSKALGGLEERRNDVFAKAKDISAELSEELGALNELSRQAFGDEVPEYVRTMADAMKRLIDSAQTDRYGEYDAGAMNDAMLNNMADALKRFRTELGWANVNDEARAAMNQFITDQENVVQSFRYQVAQEEILRSDEFKMVQELMQAGKLREAQSQINALKDKYGDMTEYQFLNKQIEGLDHALAGALRSRMIQDVITPKEFRAEDFPRAISDSDEFKRLQTLVREGRFDEAQTQIDQIKSLFDASGYGNFYDRDLAQLRGLVSEAQQASNDLTSELSGLQAAAKTAAQKEEGVTQRLIDARQKLEAAQEQLDLFPEETGAYRDAYDAALSEYNSVFEEHRGAWAQSAAAFGEYYGLLKDVAYANKLQPVDSEGRQARHEFIDMFHKIADLESIEFDAFAGLADIGFGADAALLNDDLNKRFNEQFWQEIQLKDEYDRVSANLGEPNSAQTLLELERLAQRSGLTLLDGKNNDLISAFADASRFEIDTMESTLQTSFALRGVQLPVDIAQQIGEMRLAAVQQEKLAGLRALQPQIETVRAEMENLNAQIADAKSKLARKEISEQDYEILTAYPESRMTNLKAQFKELANDAALVAERIDSTQKRMVEALKQNDVAEYSRLETQLKNLVAELTVYAMNDAQSHSTNTRLLTYSPAVLDALAANLALIPESRKYAIMQSFTSSAQDTQLAANGLLGERIQYEHQRDALGRELAGLAEDDPRRSLLQRQYNEVESKIYANTQAADALKNGRLYIARTELENAMPESVQVEHSLLFIPLPSTTEKPKREDIQQARLQNEHLETEIAMLRKEQRFNEQIGANGLYLRAKAQQGLALTEQEQTALTEFNNLVNQDLMGQLVKGYFAYSGMKDAMKQTWDPIYGIATGWGAPSEADRAKAREDEMFNVRSEMKALLMLGAEFDAHDGLRVNMDQVGVPEMLKQDKNFEKFLNGLLTSPGLGSQGSLGEDLKWRAANSREMERIQSAGQMTADMDVMGRVFQVASGKKTANEVMAAMMRTLNGEMGSVVDRTLEIAPAKKFYADDEREMQMEQAYLNRLLGNAQSLLSTLGESGYDVNPLYAEALSMMGTRFEAARKTMETGEYVLHTGGEDMLNPLFWIMPVRVMGQISKRGTYEYNQEMESQSGKWINTMLDIARNQDTGRAWDRGALDELRRSQADISVRVDMMDSIKRGEGFRGFLEGLTTFEFAADMAMTFATGGMAGAAKAAAQRAVMKQLAQRAAYQSAFKQVVAQTAKQAAGKTAKTWAERTALKLVAKEAVPRTALYKLGQKQLAEQAMSQVMKKTGAGWVAGAAGFATEAVVFAEIMGTYQGMKTGDFSSVFTLEGQKTGIIHSIGMLGGMKAIGSLGRLTTQTVVGKPLLEQIERTGMRGLSASQREIAFGAKAMGFFSEGMGFHTGAWAAETLTGHEYDYFSLENMGRSFIEAGAYSVGGKFVHARGQPEGTRQSALEYMREARRTYDHVGKSMRDMLRTAERYESLSSAEKAKIGEQGARLGEFMQRIPEFTALKSNFDAMRRGLTPELSRPVEQMLSSVRVNRRAVDAARAEMDAVREKFGEQSARYEAAKSQWERASEQYNREIDALQATPQMTQAQAEALRLGKELERVHAEFGGEQGIALRAQEVFKRANLLEAIDHLRQEIPSVDLGLRDVMSEPSIAGVRDAQAHFGTTGAAQVGALLHAKHRMQGDLGFSSQHNQLVRDVVREVFETGNRNFKTTIEKGQGMDVRIERIITELSAQRPSERAQIEKAVREIVNLEYQAQARESMYPEAQRARELFEGQIDALAREIVQRNGLSEQSVPQVKQLLQDKPMLTEANVVEAARFAERGRAEAAPQVAPEITMRDRTINEVRSEVERLERELVEAETAIETRRSQMEAEVLRNLEVMTDVLSGNRDRLGEIPAEFRAEVEAAIGKPANERELLRNQLKTRMERGTAQELRSLREQAFEKEAQLDAARERLAQLEAPVVERTFEQVVSDVLAERNVDVAEANVRTAITAEVDPRTLGMELAARRGEEARTMEEFNAQIERATQDVIEAVGRVQEVALSTALRDIVAQGVREGRFTQKELALVEQRLATEQARLNEFIAEGRLSAERVSELLTSERARSALDTLKSELQRPVERAVEVERPAVIEAPIAERPAPEAPVVERPALEITEVRFEEFTPVARQSFEQTLRSGVESGAIRFNERGQIENIEQFTGETRRVAEMVNQVMELSLGVKGYTNPTKLQVDIISDIIQGRSKVYLAGTGAGKSAFIIPTSASLVRKVTGKAANELYTDVPALVEALKETPPQFYAGEKVAIVVSAKDVPLIEQVRSTSPERWTNAEVFTHEQWAAKSAAERAEFGIRKTEQNLFFEFSKNPRLEVEMAKENWMIDEGQTLRPGSRHLSATGDVQVTSRPEGARERQTLESVLETLGISEGQFTTAFENAGRNIAQFEQSAFRRNLEQLANALTVEKNTFRPETLETYTKQLIEKQIFDGVYTREQVSALLAARGETFTQLLTNYIKGEAAPTHTVRESLRETVYALEKVAQQLGKNVEIEFGPRAEARPEESLSLRRNQKETGERPQDTLEALALEGVGKVMLQTLLPSQYAGKLNVNYEGVGVSDRGYAHQMTRFKRLLASEGGREWQFSATPEPVMRANEILSGLQTKYDPLAKAQVWGELIAGGKVRPGEIRVESARTEVDAIRQLEQTKLTPQQKADAVQRREALRQNIDALREGLAKFELGTMLNKGQLLESRPELTAQKLNEAFNVQVEAYAHRLSIAEQAYNAARERGLTEAQAITEGKRAVNAEVNMNVIIVSDVPMTRVRDAFFEQFSQNGVLQSNFIEISPLKGGVDRLFVAGSRGERAIELTRDQSNAVAQAQYEFQLGKISREQFVERTTDALKETGITRAEVERIADASTVKIFQKGMDVGTDRLTFVNEQGIVLSDVKTTETGFEQGVGRLRGRNGAELDPNTLYSDVKVIIAGAEGVTTLGGVKEVMNRNQQELVRENVKEAVDAFIDSMVPDALERLKVEEPGIAQQAQEAIWKYTERVAKEPIIESKAESTERSIEYKFQRAQRFVEELLTSPEFAALRESPRAKEVLETLRGDGSPIEFRLSETAVGGGKPLEARSLREAADALMRNLERSDLPATTTESGRLPTERVQISESARVIEAPVPEPLALAQKAMSPAKLDALEAQVRTRIEPQLRTIAEPVQIDAVVDAQVAREFTMQPEFAQLSPAEQSAFKQVADEMFKASVGGQLEYAQQLFERAQEARSFEQERELLQTAQDIVDRAAFAVDEGLSLSMAEMATLNALAAQKSNAVVSMAQAERELDELQQAYLATAETKILPAMAELVAVSEVSAPQREQIQRIAVQQVNVLSPEVARQVVTAKEAAIDVMLAEPSKVTVEQMAHLSSFAESAIEYLDAAQLAGVERAEFVRNVDQVATPELIRHLAAVATKSEDVLLAAQAQRTLKNLERAKVFATTEVSMRAFDAQSGESDFVEGLTAEAEDFAQLDILLGLENSIIDGVFAKLGGIDDVELDLMIEHGEKENANEIARATVLALAQETINAAPQGAFSASEKALVDLVVEQMANLVDAQFKQANEGALKVNEPTLEKVVRASMRVPAGEPMVQSSLGRLASLQKPTLEALTQGPLADQLKATLAGTKPATLVHADVAPNEYNAYLNNEAMLRSLGYQVVEVKDVIDGVEADALYVVNEDALRNKIQNAKWVFDQYRVQIPILTSENIARFISSVQDQAMSVDPALQKLGKLRGVFFGLPDEHVIAAVKGLPLESTRARAQGLGYSFEWERPKIDSDNFAVLQTDKTLFEFITGVAAFERFMEGQNPAEAYADAVVESLALERSRPVLGYAWDMASTNNLQANRQSALSRLENIVEFNERAIQRLQDKIRKGKKLGALEDRVDQSLAHLEDSIHEIAGLSRTPYDALLGAYVSYLRGNDADAYEKIMATLTERPDTLTVRIVDEANVPVTAESLLSRLVVPEQEAIDMLIARGMFVQDKPVVELDGVQYRYEGFVDNMPMVRRVGVDEQGQPYELQELRLEDVVDLVPIFSEPVQAQAGAMQITDAEGKVFDVEAVRFIGSGTFGRAFEARLSDGRKVLLKMPTNMLVSDTSIKSEYAILKRAYDAMAKEPSAFQEHIGVAEPIGTGYVYLQNTKVPIVVQEFIESARLWDWVQTANEQDRAFVQDRVRDAIERLHRQGLAHFDLKGDNILVTKDLEVILVDWGKSVQEGEELYAEAMKNDLDYIDMLDNEFGIVRAQITLEPVVPTELFTRPRESSGFGVVPALAPPAPVIAPAAQQVAPVVEIEAPTATRPLNVRLEQVTKTPYAQAVTATQASAALKSQLAQFAQMSRSEQQELVEEIVELADGSLNAVASSLLAELSSQELETIYTKAMLRLFKDVDVQAPILDVQSIDKQYDVDERGHLLLRFGDITKDLTEILHTGARVVYDNQKSYPIVKEGTNLFIKDGDQVVPLEVERIIGFSDLLPEVRTKPDGSKVYVLYRLFATRSEQAAKDIYKEGVQSAGRFVTGTEDSAVIENLLDRFTAWSSQDVQTPDGLESHQATPPFAQISVQEAVPLSPYLSFTADPFAILQTRSPGALPETVVEIEVPVDDVYFNPDGPRRAAYDSAAQTLTPIAEAQVWELDGQVERGKAYQQFDGIESEFTIPWAVPAQKVAAVYLNGRALERPAEQPTVPLNTLNKFAQLALFAEQQKVFDEKLSTFLSGLEQGTFGVGLDGEIEQLYAVTEEGELKPYYEGSGAVVVLAKLKGASDLYAVKVLKNPLVRVRAPDARDAQLRFDYFLNEIQAYNDINRLKLGPAFKGVARAVVDGQQINPAYVMEHADMYAYTEYQSELSKFTEPLGLTTATQSEVEANVREYLTKIARMLSLLSSEGYILPDFQYGIAKDAQTLSGVAFVKGDPVLIDIGSAERLTTDEASEENQAQFKQEFESTMKMLDLAQKQGLLAITEDELVQVENKLRDEFLEVDVFEQIAQEAQRKMEYLVAGLKQGSIIDQVRNEYEDNCGEV